jgi:hypothetical protein
MLGRALRNIRLFARSDAELKGPLKLEQPPIGRSSRKNNLHSYVTRLEKLSKGVKNPLVRQLLSADVYTQEAETDRILNTLVPRTSEDNGRLASEAYLVAAQVQEAMGNTDRVIELFQQYRNKGGKVDPKMWRVLAYSFVTDHRAPEAIALCKKVNHPIMMTVLAKGYAAMNNTEGLKEVVAASPPSKWAPNDFTLTLATASKYNSLEAVQWLVDYGVAAPSTECLVRSNDMYAHILLPLAQHGSYTFLQGLLDNKAFAEKYLSPLDIARTKVVLAIRMEQFEEADAIANYYANSVESESATLRSFHHGQVPARIIIFKSLLQELCAIGQIERAIPYLEKLPKDSFNSVTPIFDALIDAHRHDDAYRFLVIHQALFHKRDALLVRAEELFWAIWDAGKRTEALNLISSLFTELNLVLPPVYNAASMLIKGEYEHFIQLLRKLRTSGSVQFRAHEMWIEFLARTGRMEDVHAEMKRCLHAPNFYRRSFARYLSEYASPEQAVTAINRHSALGLYLNSIIFCNMLHRWVDNKYYAEAAQVLRFLTVDPMRKGIIRLASEIPRFMRLAEKIGNIAIPGELLQMEQDGLLKSREYPKTLTDRLFFAMADELDSMPRAETTH